MKQYDVHFQELTTGETLAYRKAGEDKEDKEDKKDRPVYVLLHGNQSGSFHWQPLMEAMEEQATLCVPDLPGFGDSTYHARFDSLYELAVHIDAWMEALHLSQAVVVGWSTGGGVALELAATFPERVAHLVLLSSVGLSGYPVYGVNEQFQPDLTKRLCSKEEIAEHPLSVKPVLDAYATGNKAFMKMVWSQAIYNIHPISDEDFEIYLDGMFKQRNLVDIVYSLSQFNITDVSNGCSEGSGKVHQITCPVTIIQGGKDLVVPPVWASEAKAAFGDLATLHLFDDCGHSIVTDNLDGLVNVLEDIS